MQALCPKCNSQITLNPVTVRGCVGVEVKPCLCMTGPKAWNSHLQYLRGAGFDIPAEAFLRKPNRPKPKGGR